MPGIRLIRAWQKAAETHPDHEKTSNCNQRNGTDGL